MASRASGLDHDRFPSVVRYLERLPGGLFAYPACQAKASLLRSLIDDFAMARVAPALPSALAELVLHPPPAGDWIPEVHFRAIMRAILDEFFRNRAEFIAWSYVAQQRLLGGPLYRILFSLITPERIARAAHNRWNSFHRGTTLDIDLETRGGIVTLVYPPHSHDLLDNEATMAGIRVALELSGARQVASETLEVSPTYSHCRISWQ